MLSSKEFDLWSDGYDKSVQLSERSNTYPFAGYQETCRAACGDNWDEEEIYPVAEILKAHIPELEFRKITFCSGVMSITQ